MYTVHVAEKVFAGERQKLPESTSLAQEIP